MDSEEPAKTPGELLSEAALAITSHCKAAPKGPRLAYSVDVVLIENLEATLKLYAKAQLRPAGRQPAPKQP